MWPKLKWFDINTEEIRFYVKSVPVGKPTLFWGIEREKAPPATGQAEKVSGNTTSYERELPFASRYSTGAMLKEYK